MLSSQLDPEVSRLLKAKDEGPIICRECGEWKDRSECWASRKICKPCGSRMNASKWKAKDALVIKMHKRNGILDATIKHLGKLVYEGECLVCDCVGFHADSCEAWILIKKLKALQ